MSEYFLCCRYPATKAVAKQRFPGVLELLCMIAFTGPWRLLTARISGKCATFMILLCIPSLVVCATLLLPGWIFQSPHQQGYYYFGLMLGQDPLRWVAIFLAALCSIFSLAMPRAIDEGR